MPRCSTCSTRTAPSPSSCTSTPRVWCRRTGLHARKWPAAARRAEARSRRALCRPTLSARPVLPAGTTRADGETVGFETEGTAVYDTMCFIKNEVGCGGGAAAAAGWSELKLPTTAAARCAATSRAASLLRCVCRCTPWAWASPSASPACCCRRGRRCGQCAADRRAGQRVHCHVSSTALTRARVSSPSERTHASPATGQALYAGARDGDAAPATCAAHGAAPGD